MSSGPILNLFYSRKRGFLLIELMIALTMVSIIALSVGAYHAYIMAGQLEGKNRLVAVSLARTALEHICAGYQHSISLAPKPFMLESITQPPVKGGFSAVRVVVSWEQKKGVIRSVILDSGVYHENA
jgi:prepilin-type N-terminal cleavage/methylation domain-containing protein